MRLHLACGKHILEGWVNLDMVKHPQATKDPDLIGVDVAKLPFNDAEADEIMAIHIFEHFYEWEVDDLLNEWARVLKTGGKLVLEMPDLVKSCRNVINDPSNLKMGMWPLYGDNTLKDPLMCHKWAWTFSTIKPRLEQAGFSKVKEKDPLWHGKKVKRDFRVEAIK